MKKTYKSFSELPDPSEPPRLWKQEPVTPPEPDLELTPDSWVERGAEVLGWWLAKLEHWLSASGWLRAWVRMNLFFAVILTTAGLLLLPPVSRVLEQIANSSHWLGRIAGDLFTLLTALPPVVLSLAALYIGYLLYRRFRRKRLPHRGGYPHEDYYQ